MANPNDPRTPEERRTDERRRIELENEREVSAGSGWWAWWWLWLIIILFIVWFGGWGWGGYGGWWGWGGRRVVTAPTVTNAQPTTGYGNRTAANNTGANGASAPIANVAAIVNSNNKQQFIGRPVDLKDVAVQDVNPHGTLWIGQNQRKQVLVVEQGAGNGRPMPSKVQKGETINIQGTVEHVQNADQLQKQWNLTSAEAQKAEKDGVYIAAETINPTQAGSGPQQ